MSFRHSVTNRAAEKAALIIYIFGRMVLRLPNTPTRSPETPETRINKGKNKENRIARGQPAGGPEAPDGCTFVLGL